MQRRKFSWTKKQVDKLNKINDILEELADYIPLTLRQIYYQLVGKGYIENSKSQYGMLSGLLKHARLEGLISWKDIEDRTRTYHDFSGWVNHNDFIDAQLSEFLTHYNRDLLQSQGKYIELWIEKDALTTLFRRVANEYGISVVVCKGFSSISFLYSYKERLLDHPGKKPVMLYFGDFDPSGVCMLDAMKTTFETELGIQGVEYKRIALHKDDIEKYNLPHDPDALKVKDTRSKKFVAEYGEYAVELDALRPDVLVEKIKDAIEYELDVDAFNYEVDLHNAEIERLNIMKCEVETFIKQIGY